MSLIQTIADRVTADLSTRILAARFAGAPQIEISSAELVQICRLFNRKSETNSQITTITQPRWKGGKKNEKVGLLTNPDGVVKIARYNCNLGVWSAHVDRQVGREGIVAEPYEPLPPNGKDYVGDSPIMVAQKDPTQFYLSVMPIGFWHEAEFRTLDGLLLPNLSAEEYRWEGVSRVERETGVSKVPLIRTPKIENIRCLAPWGRGSDGRFQSIELQFFVRRENSEIF